MNIKPNTSLYKILEVSTFFSSDKKLPTNHCSLVFSTLWGLFCIYNLVFLIPWAILWVCTLVYSVATFPDYTTYAGLSFLPINTTTDILTRSGEIHWLAILLLPSVLLLLILTVLGPVLAAATLVIFVAIVVEKTLASSERVEYAADKLSEGIKVTAKPFSDMYKAYKEKYCITVTYKE